MSHDLAIFGINKVISVGDKIYIETSIDIICNEHTTLQLNMYIDNSLFQEIVISLAPLC